MPVITVSRQYASGGGEIAKLVAEQLGWTLIDSQLVDRVAERVGLPPEEVARLEERVPSLVERLATTLSISSPELFLTGGDGIIQPPGTEHELVRMTEAVIEEAATTDAVLVGRGAQACLSGRSDVLHVRVVAHRAHRIALAVERLTISEKEAERRLERIDEERRKYVQTHYSRDWNDPINYHLTINAALVNPSAAAELITSAVRQLTTPT